MTPANDAYRQFETCLVAVSRIQEVVELPPEEEGKDERAMPLILEDPDDKQDPDAGSNEKGVSKTIESDWITSGSIQFQHAIMRYKPDLPPALKGISFRVQGGQKVGIVGRTGCGKSTVLQALFRMVSDVSGLFY